MTADHDKKKFQNELDAARRRSDETRPDLVKSAHYDLISSRVMVELNNGTAFGVPAHFIQGLEQASPAQLTQIEVTPLGDGLRWDELDVDVDALALSKGVFGTRAWMAELGARGGRATTPEKAEAARANGQRGGRPSSLGRPFWARLSEVGITRPFVLENLISPALQNSYVTATTRHKDALLPEIARSLQSVFSWSLDDILGDRELSFASGAGGTARFKIPAGSSRTRTPAYVVYAHYLMLLAIQTTQHLPARPLEQSAEEMQAALLENYGAINLKSALEHLWTCGVTVLPLRDSGIFHGACWRVQGRNGVVLKQVSSSEAHWLIDVLHEWSHVADHPEQEEFEVVEYAETSRERRTSDEEKLATLKAGEVALQGRAEQLTDLCVERANGSVERLKRVVPEVASIENIDVGLLANYIAFRLSLQGHNWWGAAANLQVPGRPFELARELFLQHAQLDQLNDLDRTLLQRALITQEA